MITTEGILRKIRKICTNSNRCDDCQLYGRVCGILWTSDIWTNELIKEAADIIDDYEERR